LPKNDRYYGRFELVEIEKQERKQDRMKVKAACIGTPESVVKALSGKAFSFDVLTSVIGVALGVSDVMNRPAEYYVQNADEGPSSANGVMGVEVRLTGASREGRTAKQFHSALKALVNVTKAIVSQSLWEGERCQIFCVIMVDGDIETAPGSGKYSNNLESTAEWVEGKKPC